MNTAKKIESASYPKYRRRSDRLRAVSLTLQRVEQAHISRQRRLALMLGTATVLLLLNGLLIAALL